MVDAERINAMIDEHWPASPIRCEQVDAETAVAVLRPRPSALRPGGFISGPVQFAVADSALWFLVSGVAGEPEPMALTSELSIRYLRPAIGELVRAKATLERAGRRTVVATVRVWTDDPGKPCATAQGTYFRAQRS